MTACISAVNLSLIIHVKKITFFRISGPDMSLQPTFYKNRKFPSMKDSQPPKSELLPGFPGFDPPGYIPPHWGQIGVERDHGVPRNGAGLGSSWGQSNQDKEPGSPINGARLRPGWGQLETERDPGAPRKPPRTPRFNQNRYSPSRELFTQMRKWILLASPVCIFLFCWVVGISARFV